MKLTKDIKARIDRLSFQGLLGKWRKSAKKDPFFDGPIGMYFWKRINEKRDETDDNGEAANQRGGCYENRIRQ